MAGSDFISFIEICDFQKMEMFVSEIWNQILHNIKIAQGAWNVCHMFWTSLTTYRRKQAQKMQYRKPHVAQQVLLQNRGVQLHVPLRRAYCISFAGGQAGLKYYVIYLV